MGQGSRGPARAIGRFQLLGELGRGAFGAVFRAFDPQHQREVAIKVLLRESPRASARFQREIEATLRLRHPNLVPVLESGVHQGRPFLVMDYVGGDTLAALVEGGRRIPVGRAVELLRDAARGVHYAHEQGIFHRDLKPDNVLIDAGGSPRVLDFGLAFLLSEEERLSMTGGALGTPTYMAPEQGVGARPTAQTDVYGLGATLYFVLAGQGPFDDEEDPWLAAHRIDPRPPSEHNPAVTPALDATVLRALRKTPAERQPSAAAFADELSAFLSGSSLSAPPARASRARWAPALAVGGGLLLAGGLGAWAALAPQAPEQAKASPAASPSPSAVAYDWSPFRAALAEGSATQLAELLAASPEGAEREQASRWVEAVQRLERARNLASELAPAAELFAPLDEARALVEGSPVLEQRWALAQLRAALHRNERERAEAALPLLEAGPHAREARFLHGLLLFRGADVERGDKILSGLQGEDLWAWLAEGWIASRAFKHAEALRLAQAALRASPEEPQARLLRAVALSAAQQDVGRAFAELVGEGASRDDAMVWVRYAVHATTSGDLRRSRDYLARAQSLCAPGACAGVERVEGLLLLLEGQHRAAAKKLEQTIERDPRDVGAWMLLGVARHSHEDYAAAEASWRVAYKQGPQRFAAVLETIQPVHLRLRIARCVGIAPPFRDGLPEMKILTPASLVEVGISAEAAPALSEALTALGRGEPWDRIRPHFDAAEAAAPKDGGVLGHKAVALCARARFAEAEAAFARARAAGEASRILELHAAEAVWRRGEGRGNADANERFRALAQLEPPDAVALTAQALGAWATGKAERARKLASAAWRQVPLALAAQIEALALVDLRRGADALAVLDTATRHFAYSRVWLLQTRADLTLALAGRDEKLRDLGIARELVVSCVAPERAQPFQRLLEHVLELPREHRFFNSAVMWMDDLLARCGKHDPAGFRRARVLFGLMLLRRGHPAGDVLRHWQRSSPQSVRPTVPKRYQQIFARTYGAPPDLESIAPQAPAEQKAPAEKR